MEGVWAVPVPFLVGSTIYLPVEHLLPGGMFLAAVEKFHRRLTETPLLPLGSLTQSQSPRKAISVPPGSSLRHGT